MTHTFADLETLARTLYGEARGETWAGRRAVAHVILNRVQDTRWPDTVAEVCRQKWQFSCWNENDPNCTVLQAAGLDDPALRDCLTCAMEALGLLAGMGLTSEDPTGGANHYLTKRLAETNPPRWYDPSKVTATMGNHVFLKL